MRINGREIGRGQSPYFVAELSANHGGNLERALATISAAKEAGADAVKIQSYTPDTITIDHHGPGFDITEGPWAGRSLYELYQEAYTPFEWHEKIFSHAREVGITLFSAPFDPSAVSLLERLDTPAYKIASFELVDTPLISLVAATGKPLILSTGMASDEEIADALAAGAGVPTVLLHCISAYPAPLAEANLPRIAFLRRKFGCDVGLSDHTLGPAAAIAAVTQGAVLIEKHFILDRSFGGADAEFSMQPDEFRSMVAACRGIYLAMQGKGERPAGLVEQAAQPHRRSLYVVADVPAGGQLTTENVRSIRPGLGLPPKYLDEVLGCSACRDLKRGEPVQWDMIEDGNEGRDD